MSDMQQIEAVMEVDVGETMQEEELFEVADEPGTDVDESKAPDDASIMSGSSGSTQIEPFEEYLPKIEQLLNDIGLDGFSVEVVQRGFSCQNCVYALKSTKDEDEQYILRVPVCPDFEDDGTCVAVENDAAVLGYLAGKFPVARVKAYSIKDDNALGAPYTVQTRLPGQSLDVVYNDLDYDDKLRVIDQYVDLLAELESITFPTAGTFEGAPLLETSTDSNTPPTPTITVFQAENDEPTNDPKVIKDRAGPDVKLMLASHLNVLIDNLNDDWRPHLEPMYRQLLKILEELEAEGALNDGPFPVVLHHWDLEPRNIMVENSSGSWTFCGVIDWDDTLTLPRPLARRAPDWIWELEGGPVYTGYLDNDHQPNEDLSEDQLALKAYFDKKAASTLPKYLEDAYGRGLWLRRVWTFARAGASDNWFMELIEQMVKEWEARPKPVASRPEQSSKLQSIDQTDAPASPSEQPLKLQSVDLADAPPAKPNSQSTELQSVNPTDTEPVKPKALWKNSVDWFTQRVQALRV